MATAGLFSLLLAIGHETLGVAWILRGVTDEGMAKTPFGSERLSATAIHATWHIVTVFAGAVGIALLIMAVNETADPKTVVLRVFAAMWLGIAIVATSTAVRRVRRVRDLLRLPVPVFFVITSVLCWVAST